MTLRLTEILVVLVLLVAIVYHAPILLAVRGFFLTRRMGRRIGDAE